MRLFVPTGRSVTLYANRVRMLCLGGNGGQVLLKIMSREGVLCIEDQGVRDCFVAMAPRNDRFLGLWECVILRCVGLKADLQSVWRDEFTFRYKNWKRFVREDRRW